METLMTTTIKIYGASDDLVEVEGKASGCDEFGFYATGKPGYLACSDGTVLRVCYAGDKTGCWRVAVEQAGAAAFEMVRKGDEDADEQDGVPGYSDLATLTGVIDKVRRFGMYPWKTGAIAAKYKALWGVWPRGQLERCPHREAIEEAKALATLEGETA